MVRPIISQTAYEILHGRIPNISHFKFFNLKCFILKTKDQLNKFDSMSQDCLFLGYALNNSCYRVYNLETNVVEESTNVVFDEAQPNKELAIDYEEGTNVEEPHKDRA